MAVGQTHAEMIGAIQDSDHPADRMLRRIQRSMRMIRDTLDHREKYADLLGIRYHDTDQAITADAAADGEDFRRHGENYSFRYMRHLMSQVSGEPLHIRTDRDASGGQMEKGVPGDAHSGSWVDELYRRSAFEAGLEKELAKCAMSFCAYGCYAMSKGYMDGNMRAEAIREAAKDQNDVIEDVLVRGDKKAKPGQDHETIAFHLTEQAQNGELTRDQQDALMDRADSHRAMRRFEEKQAEMRRAENPDDRWMDWRLADQIVWARYRMPGLDAVWDMTKVYHDDTSWRAERVMVPIDKFKKDAEMYSAAARAEAQGLAIRERSMLADDTQPRSDTSDSDRLTDRERLVETWVVWIRRPEMRSGGVRRIVSPELQGMWIHKDESYPYTIEDLHELDGVEIEGPEHGLPTCEDWWPLEIDAPLMAPRPVPESMLGIPGIAPGWAKQIEINQYAFLAFARAMRAIRVFLGDKNVISSDKERLALENAIRGGKDGYMQWVTRSSQDKDLRGAVAAIDFGNDAIKMLDFKGSAITAWGNLQGMPPTVLQLVGVSETASQDDAAIAQGDAELQQVIKVFEATAARVLRFWAGCIREYYSEEKIRRLLGAKGADAILTWKKNALDGDRIQVRVGPRARREDRVDKKQLAEAIQLIATLMVDDIGATTVDLKPLFEELLRSHGVGTLEELQTDPSDPRYHKVLQTLDMMAKAIQELQQRAPGGESKQIGTPGPDAQPNITSQAPQEGALMSGARKETIGV